MMKEIENRLRERLRIYTALKRSFIKFLQTKIPLMNILEHYIIFHCVLILSTLLLLVGIFLIIRRLSLFSEIISVQTGRMPV